MQQRQLRVGVIGTGGMGGRHVANITDEVTAARVVALMDIDGSRLQEVAQQCGAALTFTDGHELIEHPDVEALIIAAPDQFHAELAHASVLADKPVLCEKPLASSAAEAQKVIDAEIAVGRRLVQLGFMREYDPAHVRVKELVDSGNLGAIIAFRGTHINPTKGQLRSVEDIITNSAIHDIHSARWMMDDEISTVYTSYLPGEQNQPDTARIVLLQLQFRSGGLGHIECNSESGYGYEVDVKMTGETGSVQTNSIQSAFVSYGNHRGQWIESDWLQRFEVAYVHEVRDWVQSTLDGKSAGPTAWDGYVAMLVADAGIESAKSGLPATVEIPPIPAIYRR